MSDASEEGEASYGEWLADLMDYPPAVQIALNKLMNQDHPHTGELPKTWKYWEEELLYTHYIKVHLWFGNEEKPVEILVSSNDALEFMKK